MSSFKITLPVVLIAGGSILLTLLVFKGATSSDKAVHDQDNFKAIVPEIMESTRGHGEIDVQTIYVLPGTWTDPLGLPGNQVTFSWSAKNNAPMSLADLAEDKFESDGEMKRIFSADFLSFKYGFKSFGPTVTLYLNSAGNQQLILAKAKDHNHLRLMRISRDIASQDQDYDKPIGEPAIDMVRLKEPDRRPDLNLSE